MKEKEISVRHPYFLLLQSGEKKVEGRLYDSFFRDLGSGDILVFLDETTGEKLRTEIEKIDVFPSFLPMIDFFGKQVLGFSKFSQVDTLKTYNSFYSQDEIKKYGVCGVSVKLI